MSEGETASDLYAGTKPVADTHKFNEQNLADWMAENVEGFEGPLEVRQFKGGQSNPTYQLVTPEEKIRHATQAAGQAIAKCACG